MKKLVTLCLAVLSITSIYAQPPTNNAARGVINGGRNDRWEQGNNRKYNNRTDRYYNNSDARKRRAEAINRYYNEQISDVRSARRLSKWEKAGIIKSLEDRRRQALAELRRDIAHSSKMNNRNRDWNNRRRF